MQETSFPKNKIKVVLLEGIHESAVARFQADGFAVVHHRKTFAGAELRALLADAYVLGVRSATDVTPEVLAACPRLMAIGCFCIGVNQVALGAAASRGIPVFNSPFSNSRSVAELIIAQVISLSRRLGDANREMHAGEWKKSTQGRREVRGKTLGIVGYGNIGTQLGVLAENIGLNVIFYDVVVKLAIGNARAMPTLDDLLRESDFVTLHVPQAEDTRNLISKPQLDLMKPGSYLLNASRGTVVDIPAAAAALRSGHLAGAYFDVFPKEPKVASAPFEYDELRNLPNVLLTPHIGGATHEAQCAIGIEVAGKLMDYVNTGSTDTAVNFPQLRCPTTDDSTHRICNIHKNLPGVMKEINTMLGDFNITAQSLGTKNDVGYLICDVDHKAGKDIKKKMQSLNANIRTRILY